MTNLPSLLKLNLDSVLNLDEGDAVKFLESLLKPELKKQDLEWVYLISILIIVCGADRTLDRFVTSIDNPNCENPHDLIICLQSSNLQNQFYIFNETPEVYLTNISVSRNS